jgi:hypothetical protein
VIAKVHLDVGPRDQRRLVVIGHDITNAVAKVELMVDSSALPQLEVHLIGVPEPITAPMRVFVPDETGAG